MLDPAVLNRLIDLAIVIAIVAAALLAIHAIRWRIQLEQRRRHRQFRRRIAEHTGNGRAEEINLCVVQRQVDGNLAAWPTIDRREAA